MNLSISNYRALDNVAPPSLDGSELASVSRFEANDGVDSPPETQASVWGFLGRMVLEHVVEGGLVAAAEKGAEVVKEAVQNAVTAAVNGVISGSGAGAAAPPGVASPPSSIQPPK